MSAMPSLTTAIRPRRSHKRVVATAVLTRAVASRAETWATRPATDHSRKAVIAFAERAFRELSDEIAEFEARQSRIAVLRRQRENLRAWIFRQAALREAGLPKIGLGDAAAAAIIDDVRSPRTGGK